jgi:filamentous hemagglutinin family protein
MRTETDFVKRHRAPLLNSRPAPYARWVGFVAAWILGTCSANAQLAYDGVLSGDFPGEAPSLNMRGDYQIEWTDGTLVSGGSVTNLFHGFSRFDVTPSVGAVFDGEGAPPIDHILVRIASPTGSASWIDGNVSSNIPGASLFLLNPDGFLIGENGDFSSLGAIHVSTADSLTDDRGDRFELSTEAPSVLLSGTPVQFGFLARPTGVDPSMPDIDFRGEMSSGHEPRPNVGPDPLWDGRVHISGRVIRISAGDEHRFIQSSPDALTGAGVGSVQIAAVGSQGVSLPLELSGFSAADSNLGTDAEITIEGDVRLETRPRLPASRGLAGRVVLRGGRLVSAANGRASLMRGRGGASVEGPGSDSPRPAIDIEFSQSVQLSNASLQSGSTEDSPLEDVGAIRIEAPQIILDQDTQITAVTIGGNQGASIELTGSTVVLDNATILGGTGAPIELAGSTVILDNAQILGGTSDGANCASTQGCGSVGDVSIRADQISILGTSIVRVSTNADSSGAAGNILLDAADDILIDLNAVENSLPPGIFARSRNDTNQESGHAGTIRIDARNIQILNDAKVSVSTFGAGNAGHITLAARGDVLIDGQQNTSQDIAGIYARTGFGSDSQESPADPATGNAGNIQIDAQNLRILNGAQISTAVFSRAGGDGGQIALNVSGLVSLVGSTEAPSQISAESNSLAGGSAGTIRIGGVRADDSSVFPERVELLNGGRISTSTTGLGAADSILIRANNIEIQGSNLNNPSTITTRSGLASGGGASADIALYADRDLLIRDGAILSTTSNGNDVAPGRILLEAGRNLEISGGSELRAEAQRPASGTSPPAPPLDTPGDGSAVDRGDISLYAGSVLSLEDAHISTFTRRAVSGDIEVTAERAIESFSTTILTEVDRNDGTGGDITITAPIVLLSNSSFSADANGASADAGNLLVSASSALLVDATTELSADPGQLGIAGEIILSTPETNLFSTLVVVEEQIKGPNERITNPCEASHAGEGRFEVLGLTPQLRSPDDFFSGEGEPERNSSARAGCLTR